MPDVVADGPAAVAGGPTKVADGPAVVAKIAARLLWNGLRYRYLRLAGRPGRPQAVSLEVTHRCVCRCVMCNIWKIPDAVSDLPLDTWIELLADPRLRDLRELDITGGEPFLRDDLVEIVRSACDLTRTSLPRLRSIAITTNGILTDRVLAMVQEMLEPVRDARLELVLVCALDAAGPLHDRIRRYQGAWDRVDRTLSGLLELRGTHPGLIVGLKTTVLPENVGALYGIADYAEARGLFTIVSPAIVTGGRYLNPDREQVLALDGEQRERLAGFYESRGLTWSYHTRALTGLLREGRITKPCTCGFNYFFVRSTGQVLPCPLMREQAGSITAGPIGALLSSPAARRIRRRVGRAPQCARCTEPGLERYSLPYEGWTYLRELLRGSPGSFIEGHRRAGLDKYV